MNNLPRVQLVAKMMGKDFNDLENIKSESTQTTGKEVLLSTKSLGSNGNIKPFDLKLNKGEVIGINRSFGIRAF